MEWIEKIKFYDKQNELIFASIIPVQIASDCEIGLGNRTCKYIFNRTKTFFLIAAGTTKMFNGVLSRRSPLAELVL